MTAIPPGPRDGFLGLSLASRFKANPTAFLLEMAREYGDMAYARLGPIRFFFANHPDLVRDVLVTQAKVFPKSTRQMKVLSDIDGQGLVISDGELWQRQRRLVQSALKPARLEGYARTMVAATNDLIAGWRPGATLDIAAVMTDLTLSIIGRTMFGVDLAGGTAPLRDAVHTLSEVVVKEFGAPVPIPDWVPLPLKRRKRRALAVIDGLIRGIIRERRASKEDKGDLLSLLLLAVDEDGGGMTDELVRDEAMTMFNAGHDTTASALAWCWYVLDRNPDVAVKLVAEAREVLGDRDATLADAAKLAYTECVVKETLRLYPPAIALFAREAARDTVVGGYPVPKGSWVYLSPYVLQRDPRFFPEPEKFDPDRFAPGREETIPQQETHLKGTAVPPSPLPYAYFPFGGGPHVCIGMQFALLEMKTVLATIARRWHVRLEEPHTVEPELLMSLRPKGGLAATLEAR